MIKEKDFGWTGLFYVLLLTFIIITMLVGLVGCTPSKKSQTKTENKTETTVIHDTLTKIKRDTVHVTKTETKTETKTQVRFDTVRQECPDNKITYKVNGDIELQGAIKEFSQDNLILQRKLDSAVRHDQEETRARKYWQAKTEEAKMVSNIKKGIPIFLWVVWSAAIVIALISGIYIGVKYRKYFTNG